MPPSTAVPAPLPSGQDPKQIPLISLHKDQRPNLRVSCPEFAPLIGTIVHNSKAFVAVDFADLRLDTKTSPPQIQVSKYYNQPKDAPPPSLTHTSPTSLHYEESTHALELIGSTLAIAGSTTPYLNPHSPPTMTIPIPRSFKEGTAQTDLGVVIRRPQDFVVEPSNNQMNPATRCRYGQERDERKKRPPAETAFLTSFVHTRVAPFCSHMCVADASLTS